MLGLQETRETGVYVTEIQSSTALLMYTSLTYQSWAFVLGDEFFLQPRDIVYAPRWSPMECRFNILPSLQGLYNLDR